LKTVKRVWGYNHSYRLTAQGKKPKEKKKLRNESKTKNRLERNKRVNGAAQRPGGVQATAQRRKKSKKKQVQNNCQTPGKTGLFPVGKKRANPQCPIEGNEIRVKPFSGGGLPNKNMD